MAEERKAPTAAAKQRFYVTRESQNAAGKNTESSKLNYVGMRNLADLGKIEEQDIVSARGTIRGKKNRVRAGLVNFENPKALEKRDAERGKVVVYVTSFRGVRATFEDCRYVLGLFHNLRIRVVAKDIYLSHSNHRELQARLRPRDGGGHICVPQIFIGGQHIGGKRELEELNETGNLRKILEDYPRYETANNCRVCGGFELIPCRKCGGSKNSTANKFTLEFKSLRCTHCDMNGLEECPACIERRKEVEEELKRKEMQRVECKRERRELEEAERRDVNVEARTEDKDQLQCQEQGDNKIPDTVEDVCDKKADYNSTEVQNEKQTESDRGGGTVNMADTRGGVTEEEVIIQERGGLEKEEKEMGSDIQSKDSDNEEGTMDIDALEQYIQDIVF